jgi:hypothetical protein
MTAQIITPVLSGIFMDNIGFGALFPYCSIFSVLAFLVMLFVKHGDSKPIPTEKLEAFGQIED